MKILGFEFSTSHRSVAVLELDADGNEVRHAQSVQSVERNTRGLEMTREVLGKTGLQREEMDHLVVGTGPGSLMGIRIAISMTLGWRLGHDIRWQGISAFDCLAEQAWAMGQRGELSVLIDLKCREFGRAQFNLGSAIQPFGGMERIPGDDMSSAVGPEAQCLGPDLDRAIPGARSLYPEAITLCRLAAARPAQFSNDPLVPIMLRETRFVKAPPPRFTS